MNKDDEQSKKEEKPVETQTPTSPEDTKLDPSPSSNKLPIPASKTQSLLETVLQGHDLGLDAADMENFRRATKRHVMLEQGALRVCSKKCPLHDTCEYIVHLEESKRPYKKRCPIEAEKFEVEFANIIEFVRSMDPDDNPVPNVEMGMAKDLAYLKVIEYRLRSSLAMEPDITVNTPVAGAMGQTKKEENPAISAWVRSVEKVKSMQKMLYDMVEARLKRISNRQTRRERTIDLVRTKFEENAGEAFKGTPIEKLRSELDVKIKENVDRRKKKAGGVGDGDESE